MPRENMDMESEGRHRKITNWNSEECAIQLYLLSTEDIKDVYITEGTVECDQ